jgi:RNA-directed DNA polymerase
MGGAKPFDIPKKEVWEAFKEVRANGGAAGVDGESIAEFEADLTGNLYKLWNRLSSGSYFPRPVRRVDIPKPDGGTRPLGIPTVADRVAQEVVRRRLEPLVEPRFPTATGRAARRSMPSRRHVSGAGVSIGSSISTSRASSTVFRTTFS